MIAELVIKLSANFNSIKRHFISPTLHILNNKIGRSPNMLFEAEDKMIWLPDLSNKKYIPCSNLISDNS